MAAQEAITKPCRECGRPVYPEWAYGGIFCGPCYAKLYPTCPHDPICSTFQACAASVRS